MLQEVNTVKIRELPDNEKPVFISAIFDCNDEEKRKIAEIAECEKEWLNTIKIRRKYDGKYYIDFPDADPSYTCKKDDVLNIFDEYLSIIDKIEPNKTDYKIKDHFLKNLNEGKSLLDGLDTDIKKI